MNENFNSRIKACVFCIEKRQSKCTCRQLENITVICLSVFINISFLQKTVIRKKIRILFLRQFYMH